MTETISIVVPVYYEEECIEYFISECRKILATIPFNHEFVFVDDGSGDRTVEIIKAHAADDHRIKLVELSYNHGKQAAVTAGIQHAVGDLLLYMDPDLQDPPCEIPRLVEEIQKGFDIVYGVRLDKKDTNVNRFFSHAFWWVLRKFTGMPFPEGMAVMRIFNRSFAKTFLQYREQNRFIEGIFLHVGKRSSQLQIAQNERYAGVSKFNLKRKVNLALDAILDFSEIPLKLTVKIGILLSALGFIGIVVVAILKLFNLIIVTGWASILSLTLLALGTQLFFMGIVALYVGRIYRETKGRPLYSVRSLTNIS